MVTAVRHDRAALRREGETRAIPTLVLRGIGSHASIFAALPQERPGATAAPIADFVTRHVKV